MIDILILEVFFKLKAYAKAKMELPYTVLAILFITLVRSNDGTKMSFSFKKTDGGGTLQIVDFHSIKGKVVKDAGKAVMLNFIVIQI